MVTHPFTTTSTAVSQFPETARARRPRRGARNFARGLACGGSEMEETVKKFLMTSAAALCIDWPLPNSRVTDLKGQ